MEEICVEKCVCSGAGYFFPTLFILVSVYGRRYFVVLGCRTRTRDPELHTSTSGCCLIIKPWRLRKSGALKHRKVVPPQNIAMPINYPQSAVKFENLTKLYSVRQGNIYSVDVPHSKCVSYSGIVRYLTDYLICETVRSFPHAPGIGDWRATSTYS
jgi:hypothetical protein